MSNSTMARWGVCLVLFAGSLLLYSRTYHYTFVNFDDFEYVANEPHVNSGLTLGNFRWAWTSVVGANWHPVTMISHMIDCEIYGMERIGGHHFTNALLHAANSVLVFLILSAMTGRFWPSAIVAAVFAVHPLRVESVAWISERKDVLCAFFWLLALWQYAFYVRGPSIGKYALITLLLALGMLSKPMIVTAPMLMLVLDYWPLRRFPLRGENWRANLGQFGWLVLEKLPWMALMFVSSYATYRTQSRGAVHSFKELKLGMRIQNAIVSYGDYMVQFLWPQDMAAFYPHLTVGLKAHQILRAILPLVTITFVAWSLRRRYPWLLVGWLWFIGTLVPAIGIVQVGGQARADRYTYIPAIGLTLIVVWALSEIAGAKRAWQALLTGAAAVWIFALAGITWVQTSYWRDTDTLFRHAMEVANPDRNFLSIRVVGSQCMRRGEYEKSLEYFEKALKIMPTDWPASINMGWSYYMLGDYKDARKWLLDGLKNGSVHPEDHFKLGLVELKLQNPQAALEQFEFGLKQKPNWPDAIPYLVQALNWTGRSDEARDRLEAMVPKRPRDKDVLVLTELAWILATCPDASIRDPKRALQIAQVACELTFHREGKALDTLGAALAANNRFTEAIAATEQALEINERYLHDIDAQQSYWLEREWLDPAFDMRPDVRLLSERMRERIDLYSQAKQYRQYPERGRF